MPIQQSAQALLYDEVGNIINTFTTVEAAEGLAAVYATGQPGSRFLVVPATAFVFVPDEEETP